MNEITSRDLFLLYKPGGSFTSENPKALSACFQNRFRKLNISHVTKIFFVQIVEFFIIKNFQFFQTFYKGPENRPLSCITIHYGLKERPISRYCPL